MSDEPTVQPPAMNAEELLKAVSDIVGNGKAEALLTYLVAQKIKSSRGNYDTYRQAYYQEVYGLEFKQVFEGMLATNQNRKWILTDFPGVKKMSLYQRLYQSKKYFFDHLATVEQKPYSSMIVFDNTVPGVIYLRWIREKKPDVAIKSYLVDDKETEISIAYQDKIDTFLETPNQERLVLRGLALNPEERQRLEDSFSGIEGLVYVITNSEIKLVKEREGGTGET